MIDPHIVIYLAENEFVIPAVIRLEKMKKLRPYKQIAILLYRIIQWYSLVFVFYVYGEYRY